MYKRQEERHASLVPRHGEEPGYKAKTCYMKATIALIEINNSMEFQRISK